jgi:hypothetical protein
VGKKIIPLLNLLFCLQSLQTVKSSTQEPPASSVKLSTQPPDSSVKLSTQTPDSSIKLSTQPPASSVKLSTQAAASAPEKECDWYCQLIKEASDPIPVSAPAPLTPSQLTSQITKLSSADLSTVLQNVASQLTVSKPTGNNKTSSFLTGLYSALDGLTTLLGQVTKSTDLSSISTLKQYLQSRLLQIAGSL